MIYRALVLLILMAGNISTSYAETVTIGFNYPETGPYSVQGLAQKRAADLAVEEINASGGILGQQIKLSIRDTASNADKSAANVADLIDNDGAKMIFGGSSSAVAITGGNAAKDRNTLYFGTLTYSNAVTGKDGHSRLFRESNNSWMAAQALSTYLKENFEGKKFFYITADYTWGWSTEESIRKFSGTEDTSTHKQAKTPFPGATARDFKRALTIAKASKPDVLVMVLFGNDMAVGLTEATAMGLKRNMQIVVPNLTLGMAEGAGPKVMEGVIGSLPWTWSVPSIYGYERGQQFVDKFADKYSAYPSTSAASAYSILFQYKDAVERAGSFETEKVITELQDHSYSLLKDTQTWRGFDHQNIQTVYAVKGKPQAEVKADKFEQDYFEIISSISAEDAARTHEEWKADRTAAGKPTTLE